MTTETNTQSEIKVRYRNLTVSDEQHKKDLLAAVEQVLTHGRIILGPEVTELEEQMAKYCNKKFGVGMNSGTDALYLALRSLNIGPGDEVITTPLSWIATVNAIVLCGATPVFVDIKDDLNINEELIEAAITSKTKAILPVHFTGRMCDIEKIYDIAKKKELYLVEDAAQAFGAKRNSAISGSLGDISCFSLNPMKVLCAYGEAGMVVTDNQELSEKMISLRYAGTINKEDCHSPSLNGRMDTIQAAMILVNLKRIDEKIRQRQKTAQIFTDALKDVVQTPQDHDCFHSYYSYTIVTESRDDLQQFLLSKGVETKIQHPILMPYHTAYKGKYQCDIPNAERLVDQILCLPNEEHLTEEDIQYVISSVREFFGEGN